MEKPNIYKFQDYRKFLQEILKFYKFGPRKKSLRQLAKECQISASYLSMIINGQRKMDEEWADNLSLALHFNEQEKNYFKNLIQLNDGKIDDKHKSFKKMSKFKEAKKNNQNDVEVYKYLTKWYFVAIREMATLPDFIADPEWIQKRLLKKVSIKEIREALQFLIAKKFIEIDENLKPINTFKKIDATGSIFKLSLAEFHQQVLNLAVESIWDVESKDRQILGQTVSLNPHDFELAKSILQKALMQIQELGKFKDDNTEVYHISFLGFPLTIKTGDTHEN